ncbi:MAG TPA: hypothetical protein VN887_18235 [Candidatus Angelobacter sp.]|nr:hypothetical protein [Candidatus Angelobacter sp.]
MPSATEPTGKSPRAARFRAGFERWNRKLHFYAGLFLLFFLWLFAFSGLLLNHPTWSFHESWSNRKDMNYEREIAPLGPEVKGDLAQAREILRQLGIEGEILWTTTRTNADLFEFQARRPGHFFFLKADLARHRVAVRHSVVNLWGVIKVLHTFTGVQMDDARQSRDWALTTLWAYSMDAVAAGVIFMVLSSLYMWWEFPQKRLLGAVVLGLGTLSCGLFCIGLRWLF